MIAAGRDSIPDLTEGNEVNGEKARVQGRRSPSAAADRLPLGQRSCDRGSTSLPM
jgi:hypothetical protein